MSLASFAAPLRIVSARRIALISTAPLLSGPPRRFTQNPHPSFSRTLRNGRKMEAIFTENAPAPVGPYSQAIKTPTAIYCSGSVPLNAEGVLVEGTIAEKTRQCIQNLKAVLEEAGSGIEKVVKVTIFLADMSSFAEMNGEYEKWFAHKPARSCVAVKTLPLNVDVEIELIALP